MKNPHHISREELQKMLRDYKDSYHGNNDLSDVQRLRKKVSDKDILDSIDDNIIETYLRNKKIKKIKNNI